MLKLFLGSLLAGAIAFATQNDEPPQMPPVTTVRVTPNSTQTTTTSTSTSTTTTTMPPTTTTTTAPEQMTLAQIPTDEHPVWLDLAEQVGWPASERPNLDRVIHRESRGDPTVWNRDDPMSGSRGLMQINGFWCQRTQHNDHDAGFLGVAGVVSSCDDLFDPEINLRAALAIWHYGIEEHGCGWGPWQTKGFRPCR